MLISETSEPIAQSTDPVDRVLSSPVHVRNIAFTLLSIAIVILLLQYMQPVLLPLVLGALLFYAVDPAVDWLQSRGPDTAPTPTAYRNALLATAGELAKRHQIADSTTSCSWFI